jgi:rhamnulokinase
MSGRVFAAVDLGASSGRVMAGVVDGGEVALHAVHRFPNSAREVDGRLRWDFTGLYLEVLTGLARLAHDFPQVESIGIDTWGVDYGLLDGDGVLLAEPVAYRDGRAAAVMDDVHARIGPEEVFRINGLQILPITTLYQLAAEQQDALWSKAAHIVLLPDLLAYWLTGELRTEFTNASTTGLMDAATGAWSSELLDRLNIPARLLPPIERPGAIRGPVRSDLCARLGLRPSTVVTTVGSHDTASAVVAVPATGRRFAYVSSGTWSLVGIERDAPLLTPAALAANVTNEGGVDGRTCVQRNIVGFWLLQESLRAWAEEGQRCDLTTLLAAAETAPAGGPLIDVTDLAFVPPGNMPNRIAAAARARDGRAPSTAAETVRCILDSLAAAYAATVRRVSALVGAGADVIHIVGGGSQNTALCRLTADAAGLPVTAGPVEATALGNVLVQARARGAVPPSLEGIRATIAQSAAIRRFEPFMATAQP